MEYSGKIQGNTVILDAPPGLPDGTAVVVVPVNEAVSLAREAPPLCDVLLSFAGQAQGLPDDMSENHDHYLYGVPKR